MEGYQVRHIAMKLSDTTIKSCTTLFKIGLHDIVKLLKTEQKKQDLETTTARLNKYGFS